MHWPLRGPIWPRVAACFCGEAGGVVLPLVAVLAVGHVEHGQVEGDGEAEAQQVGAVGAVDVVAVEAVEGLVVPADAVDGGAAEGEEQAVHCLDVGDGARGAP